MGNFWLWSVIAGWLVAQILKVFTGIFRQREFSVRAMLFGNGGMPSSHTAAVAALATAVALTEGLGSVSFAIAALLAIIVMNDAMGVRRETGKHSEALNHIIDALSQKEDKMERPFNLFKELIGHSPLQVFFGLITGIVVALLMSLIPAFGIY
ncbi:MAG: divergent PAP2 family protein [Clostridia bacterium]|nr:divergent PAP2 family protein [Clostridia bacterium]